MIRGQNKKEWNANRSCGAGKKKKKITLWNVSSHDTFWGSNTENQRAVKQSSASKWEVHNFRTRPFPYINDGRSTSFFLWHGTKKKTPTTPPPQKKPQTKPNHKKMRLSLAAVKIWWSGAGSYQSGPAGTPDNDSVWASACVLMWSLGFAFQKWTSSA